MHNSAVDITFMRQALDLAALGEGCVEPNPMVGCVIVADGEVLGFGYHRRFGGPHAEREALADVERHGHIHRLPTATAYVTLEPCCHHGKTPPCTDALLQARLSRVVVAMLDPFEQVAGQGVAQLSAAGIRVDVGALQAEAMALNAPYLKRLRYQRPWIIGKWAMSLDGKTATRTGHSQWISGEASRELVHEVRGRVDAILVGSGTALTDDPNLTARAKQPPARTAWRVVIDSKLQLSQNSQLVSTADRYPTLLWCGPNASPQKMQELRQMGCLVEQSTAPDSNQRFEHLLEYLTAQHRATNVLVEGGGRLLGSLLDIGQLDETLAFVAPQLIGGTDAYPAMAGMGLKQVGDGPRLASLEHRILGNDVLIRCRWDWSKSR